MDFLKFFDNELADYINNYPYKNDITEIRLRAGKNIQFTLYGKTETFNQCYVSQKQIENIFYDMCQKSQNIYEDDISEGYITLQSGHRIGIGGEFVYNSISEKYILKKLDSLNIRIAKDITCFENQDMLFALIPKSTLIVGPPHSGKTSLLKMYAKKISEQYRLVICDERNEIDIKDIGCDIIAGVKKYAAISMATRTLNPQFIICDEIGTLQEAEYILSAVNTGVNFVCTAHSETIQQIYRRPNINCLLKSQVFSRIVLLRQRDKKFFIKEIVDV